MRNTLAILGLVLSACGNADPPDDSLDASADVVDAAPSDAVPLCTRPICPHPVDAGTDSQ